MSPATPGPARRSCSRWRRRRPTIAITAPVAGDNIINKAEAAAGVTISGTATAGTGGAAVNGQTATITIVDSTNAVKDTYTTTVTGGAWSVNVTAAQAQALADGSYSIKANVSDAAGNVAVTAALGVTLDTTAPSGGPPVLTAASDFGTSHADGITDVTAPTFTVALGSTVAAGDTVQLLLGGSPLAHAVTHTVTAADITAGSVSLTVTAGDLGADGSKSITAQFTDLAGNSTTTSADVITLDTTAPVVAIGNTGGPTNQPGLSLAGTIAGADAGTTIAIFDGATQIGVGSISGGTWSASVTLGNGSNVLTAHVTDAAGNTSTSSAVTYTLSTTAPTGGTPVLTAASDFGTSHSDDVTNVTAPTFTVALGSTVVAGDTVQLLLGGSPLAHPVTHTVTAADITAGSVSLTVTAGDLGADGSKQIAAQFSDLLRQQLDHGGADDHARHHGAERRHAGSDGGVGNSGTSHADGITDVTAPTFTVALRSDGCGRRYGPAAARRLAAGACGDAYRHGGGHHRRQRQPDGDRGRPRGRRLRSRSRRSSPIWRATARPRRPTLITLDTTAPVVAIGNTGGPTNQAAPEPCRNDRRRRCRHHDRHLRRRDPNRRRQHAAAAPGAPASRSATAATSLTAHVTDRGRQHQHQQRGDLYAEHRRSDRDRGAGDRHRVVGDRPHHFKRCAERDGARQHRGALHDRRQPDCHHRDC